VVTVEVSASMSVIGDEAEDTAASSLFVQDSGMFSLAIVPDDRSRGRPFFLLITVTMFLQKKRTRQHTVYMKISWILLHQSYFFGLEVAKGDHISYTNQQGKYHVNNIYMYSHKYHYNRQKIRKFLLRSLYLGNMKRISE